MISTAGSAVPMEITACMLGSIVDAYVISLSSRDSFVHPETQNIGKLVARTVSQKNYRSSMPYTKDKHCCSKAGRPSYRYQI